MTQWIDEDARSLWHPFTQMKDCEQVPPVLIERAEGLKLYGSDGRFYYDTISSWWCNVHGHGHPVIAGAVAEQLKQLDHILFAGFSHKPAIRLARKLVSITPEGLDRVFYSDNGSTAVEIALKMSLQFWRNKGQPHKKTFICLDRGYHGDTVGAMSVSGDSDYNSSFRELMFETLKVPTPCCFRCPAGKKEGACNTDCIRFLEDILCSHSDTAAAMIMEPLLMGAGGMIIYPAAYLKAAADLAKKHNVHLILDEVATGFGRTGRMFACQHAGVSPDFLCISKGLTSGTMPFAATVTTEDVYEAFYADYKENKTFFHGHTYTANPVGCAAALASLSVFETEDTLENIQPIIKQLERGMIAFRKLPVIADIRTLGMVAAMEMVEEKASAAGGSLMRRGMKIFMEGLDNNLVLRPLGDTIYLFLPLCTTQRQLEDILERTWRVLEKFCR